MNFFQSLSELLPVAGDCTILVKKDSPSSMTVAVVPNRDAIRRQVLPFIASGSPAELDEGIVEAMTEPLRAMSGLTTNAEAVLASVKPAQNEGGETPVAEPENAVPQEKPAVEQAPEVPAVEQTPEVPAKTVPQQSEADKTKADYETMNDLYKKGKKALAEGKKGEAWSLFNKALEFCHSEKSNAILRKSIDACGHIDDDTALFGNVAS